MINALNLLWIIPISVVIGYTLAAFMVAASDRDSIGKIDTFSMTDEEAAKAIHAIANNTYCYECHHPKAQYCDKECPVGQILDYATKLMGTPEEG